MVWFKLIAPILILIIGLIQFLMAEKWYDKKTKKYKFVRKTLFGAMIAATVITVIIVLDDDKSARLLDKKLTTVQSAQDSSARGSKERDLVAQQERGVLISEIQKLESQIDPFVELANAAYPNKSTSMALILLAAEVENQRGKIDALQNYADVAKLNIEGVTGNAGAGLRESSPISEIMRPAILNKDDNIFPKCDNDSIERFKRVINAFPSYPFSYYALAFCYQKQGNPLWRQNAARAIEIFKKTTSLAGHHKQHDQALNQLLLLLEQN